jgi:hypothetical protein
VSRRCTCGGEVIRSESRDEAQCGECGALYVGGDVSRLSKLGRPAARLLRPGIRERLEGDIAGYAFDHGIEVVTGASAIERVLSDGRRIPYRVRWADLAADDEIAIVARARTLVDEIVAEHGPGKVWVLKPRRWPGCGLVHIVDDDGRIVVDGKVRLRSYFGLESAAIAAGEAKP